MDNQNDPNNLNNTNPIQPTPEPAQPITIQPQSQEQSQTVQPQSVQPQPAQVNEAQSVPQPAPQPIPQAAQPAPQPQQIPQANPGKGLGIASLILALLGIHLIAFILGIVGLNKTKKAGLPTNVPALIGIIWSSIAMFIITPLIILLVLSNFQGAQSKGRDTVTKNDINSTYQKLEEYYNENGSYPAEFTAETLRGIDSGALIDNNGNTYKFGDTTVYTELDAESQSLPTANQLYQYLPFNCINNECTGYVLRAYIENPSSGEVDVYTKYGLNNY